MSRKCQGGQGNVSWGYGHLSGGPWNVSIDTGNDSRALELCGLNQSQLVATLWLPVGIGLNYPYFLTTMETSTPACTATHVRGTGGAATEVKKALLITYKWSLWTWIQKLFSMSQRIKLDNLTLLSIDRKTKVVHHVPWINLDNLATWQLDNLTTVLVPSAFLSFLMSFLLNLINDCT